MIVIFFFPYFVFVLYLAVHGSVGASRLPHWIWSAMFSYFVASLVAVGYLGRRGAAKPRGDTEAKARGVNATRGLKIGIALYVVILLNGLGLIVQRTVPLRYALPGLLIDVLLIAVFWWLLARGRHRSDGGRKV